MSVVGAIRSPLTANPIDRAGSCPRPSLWLRLRRDPLTLLALLTLLTLGALAASADLLAAALFQQGLSQQDLLRTYAKPGLDTPSLWLGADELGRSQVVRLLYGARVSLGVAFSAAAVNITIGLALGLAAGYFRGWFDDLVQWAISTLESVPRLFLLLLVATLLGPDPLTLVLILGVLSWPRITLFVRGQTLSLREREFVLAARAQGASNIGLLARHILPNVLPLVFVLSAIDVGNIVLAESSLSFLGLGIQPPIPSWGNMLTSAALAYTRGPWLVLAPGAAIFATVLSLYLLGDGLRDALDPRLRTE